MGVAIAICLMVSIGILGRIVEEIETERSNIVSVQGTAKEDWTEETFQSFTDRLFTSYVQTDSLTMHYKVTDPAAYGVEKNAVTWGDINSEAERNRLEEEKKNYETLLSFDYETLSEEEQLTYDVLNDYFERELKMEGMELYEEVLGKYSGITSQIPVLLSEYAFYTEEDVEDYLELCRQIPDYFDEIIQYEKERAEACIRSIRSLSEELHTLCGLPLRLSQVGALKEDFEKVAETALRDGANLVNPKYVDREVILSILHKAY